MSVPCKAITEYTVKPRLNGYQIRARDRDVFGKVRDLRWVPEWYATREAANNAKAKLENP